MLGCCIRRDSDCDHVYRYNVTYVHSIGKAIRGSGCVCSCIYFIGIRVIQKIYSYPQVLVVVSKF
jgi:hypothetical protein